MLIINNILIWCIYCDSKIFECTENSAISRKQWVLVSPSDCSKSGSDCASCILVDKIDRNPCQFHLQAFFH